MQIQSYLFFEGQCQEALDFYQKTLGAEIVFNMKFGESPDPTMCAPGMEDKVMHAEFKIDATTIMASDGRCQAPAKFQGFSLSISVPNPEKAKEIFEALGEGGEVQMPLIETFYSPCFGMVADKFGVSWMVIVPGEELKG